MQNENTNSANIMTLQKGVIALRKLQNINGLIAVSSESLIGFGIPHDNIKTGTKRNRQTNSELWKAYLIGNRQYIVFQTLPLAVQARVKEAFGDLELAYWNEDLYMSALACSEANDHAFATNMHVYNDKQCGQFSEAASWLRWLTKMYVIYAEVLSGRGRTSDAAKQRALIALGVPMSEWSKGGVKEIWLTAVAKVIQSRGLKMLNVSNYRVLDKRVAQWQTEGVQSLVHGQIDNDCALKITPKMFSRILYLRSYGTEWNSVTISKTIATEFGVKLTEQRINQVIQIPENKYQTDAARYGYNASRNDWESEVKRKKLPYADLLWNVDGTAMQLYCMVDGQMIKCGYVVLVVDVFSLKIIGYKFGKTETSQLVQLALRDAINKTNYAPKFLQYDQGSANKGAEVQDFLKTMNTHGVGAQPYNGKAKRIENIIKELETVLMGLDNFVGRNITGKSREGKANPDKLKAAKVEGKIPSLENAWAQYEVAIRIYNSKCTKANGVPNDNYAIVDDNRKRLSEIQIVNMTWSKRPKTIRYTAAGLIMKLQQDEYAYIVESSKGVESNRWKEKQLGNSFNVRYNPDDLSVIHLYDEQDVWQSKAVAKMEFSAVPSEREEGEGEILHEVLRNRKAYIDGSMAASERLIAQNEANGFTEGNFETLNKDEIDAQDIRILNDITESTGVYIKPKTIKATDIYKKQIKNEEACELVEILPTFLP